MSAMGTKFFFSTNHMRALIFLNPEYPNLQSARYLLLDVLQELKEGEGEWEKFKRELLRFPAKGRRISEELLKEAMPLQLVDLLFSYYGEAYAVEVTALVLQAMDYKPLVDDPSVITWLMQFTQLCLLATLNTLKESDLKKFKVKLSKFPVKEGYVSIPRELLVEANAWELTELLLAYCDEDYAVEVASEALKAFDCEPVPECSSCFTRKAAERLCKMHVSRHRSAEFLSSKINQALEELVPSEKATKGSLERSTISSNEMICKGRKQLMEILEADIEHFVDVLYYFYVITLKEYRDICEMLKILKSEKLLSIIQERGEQSCCRFLECVEMAHPGTVLILLSAMHDLDQTPLKAAGPIEPEVVSDSERGNEAYRVCTTEAGSFHCGNTDLICDAKEAVTVTYHFDSWPKHLEEQTTEELHVAGPLLNIKVDAVEAVAAIHVPHFLCLEGDDSSHVYVAHFVEGEMRLEKPDRVEPHHAVLENPKFSSLGVVFKKWFKQKINTVVLLYHRLQLETPTFHLYLLPNDPSIIKAVDKREVNSKRIEKPPVTLKPLMIGSQVSLSTPEDVTVNPEELHFQYMDAEKLQQYVELSAEQMQEKFNFYLMKKGTTEVVWKAHLKKNELTSGQMGSPIIHPAQVGPQFPNSSKVHFIERHREALIQRTVPVEPVLDSLHDSVLSEEQYQKIIAQETNPDKMRELYKLVPSWDLQCKNKLYEALKAKNPHLVKDLEGQ
ncbi:NACHT, LRR and PYD domains-containing protein 1b allele 5-like isoform X2 [Podarcis raffonei]|uniref:NACHT, LRR and PYD domains-containing protein 1b allele 5-like isoform X2 n=1 Tax=Podarcis raffonei TaxID=65483 RepID=UPI002329691C|nr:NACHT, LRR and PYD domains-containing protein 1b allele 5-like isoform X2 [Podarcis raffonei]XP_053216640.1 NACHT, LRR and PYD domains-containing protein 1b allele 5-like isoform X2 [Podarcis raffonei]